MGHNLEPLPPAKRTGNVFISFFDMIPKIYILLKAVNSEVSMRYSHYSSLQTRRSIAADMNR
jgi:hypothetical protein